VHCEDLLVNDGSNRKAVEAVRKCLPKLDVVSTLALVVEAVDTVDGSTLVVSAENEEVFGVLDLVGEEEADGLERLLTSVDVVAEEKVVGLGGETAVLKQAQQIVVLTVDIAADLDGSLKLKEDGLGDENLAGLGAEEADFRLEELDLLAGAAASDLEEPIDYGVEVDIVLVGHCEELSRQRREMRFVCAKEAGGGAQKRLTQAVGGARSS
jgi:hypothetical protein